MPTSAADVRASYPLAAYNFRVTVTPITYSPLRKYLEITGLSVSERKTAQSMSFSEITGLTREYDRVTYRHGLSFKEGEDIVKYYIDRYVSITMKRGTTIGGTQLHEWLADKSERAIDISMCDPSGVAVMTWRVAKAVAVKLDAPGFDASTNEVAIETLEVMAAGISVKAEG
jgi:phage tail-like protein